MPKRVKNDKIKKKAYKLKVLEIDILTLAIKYVII